LEGLEKSDIGWTLLLGRIPMSDYDILLCAATYDSSECAIRMLRSVDKLEGNCLAVISGCRLEDLEKITEHEYPCDVILMKAPYNSSYLCRAWGFIWAVHMSIQADFMFTADDDLEFTDASIKMLPILKEAKDDPGFSVMGFKPSAPADMGGSGTPYGLYRVNPLYLDGNLNISQWQDNLDYGLPDSLPNQPMSYFTEVEYQHRLRALSGRPTLLCLGDVYYTHHFRTDPSRVRKRSHTCSGGMDAGEELWRKKYGIEVRGIRWDNRVCDKIYDLVKDRKDLMKSHLLFNGLWNDWSAIYELLKEGFERIM